MGNAGKPFYTQNCCLIKCLYYTISDKLAAKLNRNQIHKERSEIFPKSFRSKITTPTESGWRPKITFLNSSRDPDPESSRDSDPEDMDYSDSGSSDQSTPKSRFSYHFARHWD